jgi:hypothetical protein
LGDFEKVRFGQRALAATLKRSSTKEQTKMRTKAKKEAKANGAKPQPKVGQKPAPKVEAKKIIRCANQDKKIKLLVKENPHRPGTKVYERFKLYRSGMTVREAVEAIRVAADVPWDVKHGYIELY